MDVLRSALDTAADGSRLVEKPASAVSGEPVLGFRRPRRVVTGERADGTSYIARIEEVEEDALQDDRWRVVDPAERDAPAPRRLSDRVCEVYRIWASDRLPIELPVDGSAAPLLSSPSPDETPGALRRTSRNPQDDPSALRVSFIRFLPRDMPVVSKMEWHNTLDFVAIMAGEVEITMDGGDHVVLKPGDVVVQNGTNHRWTFSSTGAIAMKVTIGARRVGASPPPEDFG